MHIINPSPAEMAENKPVPSPPNRRSKWQTDICNLPRFIAARLVAIRNRLLRSSVCSVLRKWLKFHFNGHCPHSHQFTAIIHQREIKCVVRPMVISEQGRASSQVGLAGTRAGHCEALSSTTHSMFNGLMADSDNKDGRAGGRERNRKWLAGCRDRDLAGICNRWMDGTQWMNECANLTLRPARLLWFYGMACQPVYALCKVASSPSKIRTRPSNTTNDENRNRQQKWDNKIKIDWLNWTPRRSPLARIRV